MESRPALRFADDFEAQMLGSGGPFEIREESVAGEPTLVFAQRHPHLRAMLALSETHGDKEYIVYEDRRVTFAEHLRAVASTAAAFRDRYGVGPGDRVAILAANCPEWIVAWWATVSLGAVAVALNGWWVRDEILFGLEDSEPKLLIGDERRLARIAGDHVAVPVVEIETEFKRLWEHDPSATLPETPIDEDAAACILYTSGTTGRPKGAVNTHRNIIALNRLQTWHGLRSLKQRMESEPGAPPPPPANCVLVNSPLFHLSGLYTGAVTLLASGVKTVLMKGRFEPLRVLEVLEREKVTSWGPMGTMAHRVVHHPEIDRFDLGGVRQVGSGGAPLSAELQARMRQVFPNARASMGVGYGLTEFTGMATICSGDELERYPTSVGRALPTIDIEIRDSGGEPLPEGQEGEIYLRGPLVMQGYWRREQATQEVILPGRWLKTGDIGRLEDGYLFINSRARDLILRGGENVYPVEIEHRLEAHPRVREAAVVGIDHAELGQEVKAIVVPVGGDEVDVDELRAWVGETLAAFKVPAQWEIRSEPLPRNATGKVIKKVLVENAENPFREE